MPTKERLEREQKERERRARAEACSAKLEDFTPMERQVLEAVHAFWLESGNTYIEHDELRKKSGIAVRSFPGVIGSLQEKAMVFCFKDDLFDIEVTCRARLMLGELKPADYRTCNHSHCCCQPPGQS